jgi:hypothetical protein
MLRRIMSIFCGKSFTTLEKLEDVKILHKKMISLVGYYPKDILLVEYFESLKETTLPECDQITLIKHFDSLHKDWEVKQFLPFGDDE